MQTQYYSTDWDSLQDGITYGHGKLLFCIGYVMDNGFYSVCRLNNPQINIYEDSILIHGEGSNHIAIQKRFFKKWRNYQTDKEDIFDIRTEKLNFTITKKLDD